MRRLVACPDLYSVSNRAARAAPEGQTSAGPGGAPRAIRGRPALPRTPFGPHGSRNRLSPPREPLDGSRSKAPHTPVPQLRLEPRGDFRRQAKLLHHLVAARLAHDELDARIHVPSRDDEVRCDVSHLFVLLGGQRNELLARVRAAHSQPYSTKLEDGCDALLCSFLSRANDWRIPTWVCPASSRSVSALATSSCIARLPRTQVRGQPVRRARHQPRDRLCALRPGSSASSRYRHEAAVRDSLPGRAGVDFSTRRASPPEREARASAKHGAFDGSSTARDRAGASCGTR